ncbi:uncharacterized protein BP5553_10475 [Venustampulla echinocandica]|uniref:Deacetylase sirtuin-type domain-containing protein n=1 Tax=Venustampulla echinocandica TaxID=2656787 RepID=A0A370T9E3_9HELO|nr:uncharacterized protein BP5553_10475 [Venustampulla echinocandica]RDL30197.1 hypothetical protein BP5553_10475 [Venustampulla echinocandica]
MSAKSAFVKSRHNKASRVNSYLAAASESKKRKVSRQRSSQDWPIIIDDSPKALGQGSPKKQRRGLGIQEPLREIPASADSFIRVQELLELSKNVIVISGAGMSANAGFPTFQGIQKSRQTSFDRCLYSSPDETIRFHSTICSMFEHGQSDLCEPTRFHKVMDKLARERRLLRHITQNIDCIEQQLPDLNAKTIRLHGQVDQMRCQMCNGVYKFQPRLFQGTCLPDCQECVRRSRARVSNGKRQLRIGKLKPDVLLYGEPHPGDTEILEAVQNDLETGPDLVVVVGTKLKIPGAQSIASSICHAARSTGGFTVWISKEEPPSRARNLFDYILKGDCESVDQTK